MDKVYVILSFDANGDSGNAKIGLVYPGVFLTKEEAQHKVKVCCEDGMVAWYVETTIGHFDKSQMKKG